jgi:hypothetical protein
MNLTVLNTIRHPACSIYDRGTPLTITVSLVLLLLLLFLLSIS